MTLLCCNQKTAYGTRSSEWSSDVCYSYLWFQFDAYAPVIFDEAGAIAASGGLVGCGAAIFGSVWRARQSGNVTTYGSARWASPKDVTAAGLFDNRGVVLGRLGRHDLRHDGPEHKIGRAHV